MQAAIVQSFDAPPQVGAFAEPVAGDGETVITVSAAPLSPIVKFLAAGRHYAGDGAAGFVAGVDGVGTDPEGRRVYFLFPRAPHGSMAERTLVASSMTIPVPDALGDAAAAAIATAGVAGWVGLTHRAPLQAGQTVLVNGATGAAGAMAVQIARHLGAGRVIAVGRDAGRLSAVAADIRIAQDEAAPGALRAVFDQGVDVVLDFVWGPSASLLLEAACLGRGARTGEPRLRYVVLGNAGGNETPLRADMMRGSGLELLGSGLGAISLDDLRRGAAGLLAAAPGAGFAPDFQRVPLDAVADVWGHGSEVRYIIEPSAA